VAIKRLVVSAQLPRLGKIRKGSEKQTVNRNGRQVTTVGKDLSYFRFVGDRSEITYAFEQAYGKDPAILNVYLPYKEVEQNFEFWSEKWDASGLVHRCDGEAMVIWRVGDKYVRGGKPCPYLEIRDTMTDEQIKKDPPCEPRGRLYIILPELVKAGYVGTVTVETGGDHDILHIQKVLKAAYESRQDLRGIQFTIRRQLVNISVPGFGERKGQRARADKWMVRIEPAADWVRLQLEMAHAAQMRGLAPGAVQPVPQLQPGEIPLQGEIVEDEIDPEWREPFEVGEALSTASEPEYVPVEEQPEPAPVPAPANGNGKSRAAAVIAALVNQGLSPDPAAVMAVLKVSNLPADASAEACAEWLRSYNAWRDLGGTATQAAEKANKGQRPGEAK
jgi:hypothetical protein